MIGRTGIVVDSAAYLPPEVVDRYGVIVVPLSVELDGKEYLEGVDITPDEFYRQLESARSVSTSQPSPGRLLEAYRRAAEAGAREVVSLHIGGSVSGTVQSARVAAESSPVPVTVVDTGQASFAEGLCVLEALEALAAGAGPDEAKACVDAASRTVGNTFVVKALDLLERGGRLIGESGGEVRGAPVMAYTGEGVQPVAVARSLEEAVETMADQVAVSAERSPGRQLRVGVGHGAAAEVANALRERIERLPAVEEIIDYVVGPAIGAHTGAGTVGAVFIPRPVEV